MSDTATPVARLIPVPDWNNDHPWPPIGGLRHLIFNEKTNGFASAFKRVGRRVLIDEAEFFACVDRQNNNKGSV
ncbi:hypothetical protein RP726_14970 [Candidatus Methylospira mobilis]|uniref:hypothetical protein n=1 Tax=Candidatus Methylospira mobilis TaxID=1808979 RepID=UPI0028E2877C|nr:hypothetical protein [Candidatus Methylospira mobilis]WNV03731.1 hypothetical protein RP726_14970 [Candidatus Methylospira mobilis]